ncbi:MAG TPA: hypothetical protein QF468_00580 [Nitrospinota bacterium]|jgi:hypothetical protein|nr:hypothetical protein [Nitrospinota bacterium]|tara:strand:+ start:32146 stop:32322 length:177 start_codon:yes stop_codon:yes gene_type:complete
MNLENSFLQEIKGLIVIELSNIEKLKKELNLILINQRQGVLKVLFCMIFTMFVKEYLR